MSVARHVLLTVSLPAGNVTIEAVAQMLGVDPISIDPAFGVVLIDPASGKYAIMLDERFVSGALAREGVEGPFANPRIEPFDLQEPGDQAESK